MQITKKLTAMIFVTFCLAGCNKTPSCGDAAATDLVSQIIKDAVLADASDLADDIKKHLDVSIDQAIIVTKDENAHSYSCKAVANFEIEKELPAAIIKMGQDKALAEAVGKKFRQYIGLASPEDLAPIKEKIKKAEQENDPKLQAYRDELRTMLQMNSNATDDNVELRELEAQGVLRQSVELLQKTIASTNDQADKISTNVEYVIQKFDGDNHGNPFKVTAKYDKQVIIGQRLLQVWNIAYLDVEKEGNAPKSAQAVATSAPAVITAPTVATSPVAASTNAPPSTTSPVSAISATTAVTPPTKSTESTPQQVTAPSSPPVGKIEASFDCAKASTTIEKLICSTPESATADKNLALTYNAVKSKMGANAGQYKDAQIKWMREVRNACTDVACLVKVMNARGEQLAVEGD